MSKIRMIVTDLDGTFLRTDKTVSGYSMEVIEKLRRKGILFAVATARPVRSVKSTLPHLLFDGGIYHNGGVVMNGSKRIGGTGIKNPLSLCEKLLRYRPDCHISVESEDVLYANFDADTIWPNIDYIHTADFQMLRYKIADKMILEASSLEEMALYQPYLPDDLYLQLCENRIALIMNKRATKSNGIRMIAQRHGISMEQVVAFGDDYNDIDMLQSCGIGIAVANALDAVKENADAICDTNDNDGAARWLERHLLENGSLSSL